MASETLPPGSRHPPRADVRPESYAIRVTDGQIRVWQYRATLTDPDGEWHHVETLDRESDPRLSLDQAIVDAPGDDGYWIYSKSYDCTLDCQ
jgi:hypothetical protein